MAPENASREKPLVLLVHGFKTQAVLTGRRKLKSYRCREQAVFWEPGVQSDFRKMPEWLVADGFKVYVAHYDSNPDTTPAMEINAECLRNQIIDLVQQSPTRTIIMIVHSMGGLVARAYLDSETYQSDVEKHGGGLVDSVFFLGTPNLGMPHHILLNLNLLCERSPRQRGACEFSSRKFLEHFNKKFKHTNQNIPYYLIGGISSNSPLGRLSNAYISLVWGPNDGICPTDSSITLDGAHQTAIVNCSHMGVIGKPSYFDPAPGQKYSETYEFCIRPVIFDGNRDGCQSLAEMKRTMPLWAYPLMILWYSFVYSVSTLRYAYNHIRQ